VGFARAVELCMEEMETESARLRALRSRLLSALEEGLGGIALNGHPEQRLAANLNVSIEGVEAAALLTSLPEVALSTGSACTSIHAEPSHVLRALGLSDARVRGALRFGLGRTTTAEEVDLAAERIVAKASALRASRHAAGAQAGGA
jgi:cysteine desulfurase